MGSQHPSLLCGLQGPVFGLGSCHPPASSWQTQASLIGVGHLLLQHHHVPGPEDQSSPVHPGAMPDPWSLQALPTDSPSSATFCPKTAAPATLTCLWAPTTSLVPGASSLADPNPALQDRPLSSSLCPPRAHPAVTEPWGPAPG